MLQIKIPTHTFNNKSNKCTRHVQFVNNKTRFV